MNTTNMRIKKKIMVDKKDLKTIEKITNEFFKKTGFEIEVKVKQGEGATVLIDLNMEEPQIFIGEGGQTLTEIQRLLIAILRRKIPNVFYIDLDIQDYKKKKNEYLKDLAQSIADDVALYKKEKILSPMSAYERRIIHLAIEERQDVVSESIGEGIGRRIVVKPK